MRKIPIDIRTKIEVLLKEGVDDDAIRERFGVGSFFLYQMKKQLGLIKHYRTRTVTEVVKS